VSVDACTTRLRLVVADNAAVDEGALKHLGARGIVRPAPNALQVVLGPIADQVAGEMRESLHKPAPSELDPALASGLLAALGGRRNVTAVEAASGRALVTVAQGAAVRESDLRALAPRGIARTTRGGVQILLGETAQATCEALRRLVGEGQTGRRGTS
jgi:PTS system N-acetylglucosamine-specific IIC component